MSCVISALEKCWYLSPPWGQQMPSVEVQLWERVYITASRTFGYCCGLVWQDDQLVYAVYSERNIVHLSKHEILGTGRVQSVSLEKPAFAICNWRSRPTSFHQSRHETALGVGCCSDEWQLVLRYRNGVPSFIPRTGFTNPFPAS